MDSYAWVLDKFVEIMGRAPRLIITDQDPGLRKAVSATWKETRHRFYMWHITMKLAEKIPSRLAKDPDFKTNYDNMVWSDHNDPDVFQEHWNNMIDEYDLADNRWFTDMFEDQAFWIPAYFRDISMSGLFRTTSFSESENSNFKRFLSKKSDLVLLYTNYYSALDAQRYAYQQITHHDETQAPRMLTNLPIECHAARVFTNYIFKKLQDEIDFSVRCCGIHRMYSKEEDNVYLVADNVDGIFTIRHVHSQDYISCSCNQFIKKGLVCRHMFVVFRNMMLDEIPEKYIVKRWCKFSTIYLEESEVDIPNGVRQPASEGDFRFFKLLNEMVGYARGDDDLKEQLYNNLVQVKDKFQELENLKQNSNSKNKRFFEFYGSSPTDSLSVLPPKISKTKGSGAGGRRKSDQEKAMLLAQKPLRLC